MGKTKPKDKRLLVAKDMPPLYATIPGQPYSCQKDQVLKWISERPSLMSYVFDKLSAGGYIYYKQDWTMARSELR